MSDGNRGAGDAEYRRRTIFLQEEEALAGGLLLNWLQAIGRIAE